MVMNTNLRQIDKYTLQELLGSGGMAEVWKAWDNRLERYVAIKLLHADLQNDPDFITRFEREARLIASLRHPNIVQVYDFRISRPPESRETHVYMVMNYIEGQTLAKFLHHTAHEGNFLSPSSLVQLFAPICLAIDYAHQKGMLHRDIKPSNILLDANNTTHNQMGEPVLSDFGVARLLGASSTMHSGWRLGTPSYISPEQVMGSPGSERSDIYALSVILYEASTGTRPFRGDNPASVMMQHVHTSPVAPALINPNIPPALAATILQGLAKDPDDRFATASSLCIALAEAVEAPLPDSLKATIYQTAEMGNLTFIRPRPSNTPPPPASSTTPVSNPNNIIHVDPVLPPAQSPAEPSIKPAATSILNSSNRLGTSQPIPPKPPLPPISSITHTPLWQKKRRLNKGVLGRALVALALLAVCLSTLFFFTLHQNTSTAAAAPPTVGQASFVSSGLLNSNNSQGVNDQLALVMHNIPNPPANMAYYAWLLGDKTSSEAPVVSLGRLTVNHGTTFLYYRGDALHTNLLATESRLLITEDNAFATPAIYTPDTKYWIYYAELPQEPDHTDKQHYTVLDHLRHLLSDAPELQAHGLRGGLAIWLVRNTQKVLEWANAARDEQNNPELLHRQIVRILDYIDGEAYVRQDAPAAGSTLLVDGQDAQIPLLGPPPEEQNPLGYTYTDGTPPGYVYLVSAHLDAAVLAPGASQDQRTLGTQIHATLDRVKNLFEQIDQEAKQLVVMDDQQLAQLQTLSLLDTMLTNVQYAYNGWTDPLNGKQFGGVVWITNSIQRMAVFNIQPYKAS
jgi:serine/threonine protein kinase